VNPPEELSQLEKKKSLWNIQFLEALHRFRDTQTWDDILTVAFTQEKTWRGAWDKNGGALPDSLCAPLSGHLPPQDQRNPSEKKTLLSSLILSDTPLPPIEYQIVCGDLSVLEDFPPKPTPSPAILYAPHLEEVQGNLNLQQCQSAFLPRLKTVWGSLSLPQRCQELPSLQLVGGDLTHESQSLSLPPNLLAIGGSLLSKSSQTVRLENLTWIGKSLKTPQAWTLEAPRLNYVGRELQADHLKILDLPQLQMCGTIQSHPRTSRLPLLESAFHLPNVLIASLKTRTILKLLNNSGKKSKEFEQNLRDHCLLKSPLHHPKKNEVDIPVK